MRDAVETQFAIFALFVWMLKYLLCKKIDVDVYFSLTFVENVEDIFQSK